MAGLSTTAHLIHHLGCGTERGGRRRQRQSVDVLERLHHAQLAMPRGEESAARAFSAGVLGLLDPTDLPNWSGAGGPTGPRRRPELFKRNLTSTRFSQD
jgi:hypothetical protein